MTRIATITASEAEAVICSSPVFMRQVSGSIAAAAVPHRHRDTARQCAAWLYQDGWWEDQAMKSWARDPGGAISKRDMIRRAAREDYKECQAVGLIPSGFLAAILYGLLQAAVLAFLTALAAERLFPTDDE